MFVCLFVFVFVFFSLLSHCIKDVFFDDRIENQRFQLRSSLVSKKVIERVVILSKITFETYMIYEKNCRSHYLPTLFLFLVLVSDTLGQN